METKKFAPSVDLGKKGLQTMERVGKGVLYLLKWCIKTL